MFTRVYLHAGAHTGLQRASYLDRPGARVLGLPRWETGPDLARGTRGAAAFTQELCGFDQRW